MPTHPWQVFLLTAVVLFGLGGCNANYKFNDSTYRPLGDPQAINRGK
ncbi:type VI secretion protein [Pseudomonas sp. T1.Ur]|nr:type VI secretion protein [Pseudomonas sp. T1.Ur]MCL6704580.1 type VI secretion protein [Pseudomonas sp. T1.Ur]